MAGKPMYSHPDYPVYDRSVNDKVLLASAGERDIAWVDSNKVMCFDRIDEQVLNDSIVKDREQAEKGVPPWGKLSVFANPLWEYDCAGSVAMATCKNAVVIAKKSEIVVLNLQDGSVLWSKPLPASPVSYGLAVDGDGRIVVTLQNGQVMCFGASG